jgi:DNA gyrase subunit A
MGRTAAGVKGIELDEGDQVIGMEVIDTINEILIVTENGYGKRTPVDAYRIQGRGGKGIRTVNITGKTGNLVAMKGVIGEEDMILVTANGVVIRLSVSEISTMGRNTQGVRLMRVEQDGQDYVTTVAVIEKDDEEDVEDSEESSIVYNKVIVEEEDVFGEGSNDAEIEELETDELDDIEDEGNDEDETEDLDDSSENKE